MTSLPGREVPEPRDAASSGTLLLRMPRSLHTEVALAAERDQVDVDVYVNAVLAAAVEWRRPDGVDGLPAFALFEEDDTAPAPEAGLPLGRLLALAVAANLALAAAVLVLLLV